MMNIESYMNDGANYQAQAVLALVRRYAENLPFTKEFRGEVEVGRWENCREQGYVFSINAGYRRCKNYCVYEHRNSDQLCVQMFEGFHLNTPSIEDVFKDKRDKWDIDKIFSCEQIVECAEFIYNDMKAVYLEELEKYNAEQSNKTT